MLKRTWSVIGTGAAGTAVAALLARRGHTIAALWSRRPARARAAWNLIGQGQAVPDPAKAALAGDWVLFGVPDDALAEMAREIARAGGFRRGQTLVHLSGSRPASVLDAAPGLRVGSLHPIQTMPTAEEGIARLPGSFYGVEGSPAVVKELESLVRELGGTPLRIPAEGKPLYHAAMAMASNHLTVLGAAAAEMLARSGIDRRETLKALLPLMRGTLDALARRELPEALTGPVARGDAGTVAAHVEEIRARLPELLPLYAACARQALRLAVDKGLEPAKARDLARILR